MPQDILTSHGGISSEGHSVIWPQGFLVFLICEWYSESFTRTMSHLICITCEVGSASPYFIGKETKVQNDLPKDPQLVHVELSFPPGIEAPESLHVAT